MSVLTAGLAIMLSTQAPTPEIHCDGHEDNLRTYLNMSRILFNERQAERASEFYADEFISHNTDEGGLGKMTVRPEDMANMWNGLSDIEPDREVINNLIICKDDLVIAQVTTKGSRDGSTLKSSPEGRRRYETTAMDIYRFKDGKVVERWGNNDMVAKARQLGMHLDLSLTPLPPEE